MAVLHLLIYFLLPLWSHSSPEFRKNVINILGGVPKLGELYDGKSDQLLGPLNLFKPETISGKALRNNNFYSDTTFEVNEDYLKRINGIDIDASLKLSFMGGLVEVSGSAKYLHDSKLTENSVSTTLKFKSTLAEEELPYGLVIDNNDLCSVDGPTHVVSKVIYGLNAYMQFSKETRNVKELKEIGGKLEVVVKAIPSFQIEGSASLKFTEDEEDVSKSMSLRFFGDALISSPTNFEEAVKTYKDLESLAKISTKIVKFDLTPISFYCKDTNTILQQISDQNVKEVADIFNDFSDVKKRLNTLFKSPVAKGFPSYRKHLTTLKVGHDKFQGEITQKLQQVLPRIRGGGSAEQELTDIIILYKSSVFTKLNIRSFLDIRNKEIETIQLSLEEADESPRVTVQLGTDGDGNRCIQNAREGSVVYVIRVLPTDNLAEKFQETLPGQWNEPSKWFNDDLKNQIAGDMRNDFMDFHNANKELGICFLVNVTQVDPAAPISQIRVLKGGEVRSENFQPPKKILTSAVKDEIRGWNDYTLTISWNEPNSFITHIDLAIWSPSNAEVKTNSKNRRFSVDPGSTEARLHIKKLKPNFQYGLTFALGTEFGNGLESDELYINTLISDPPSQVQVTASTPNSIEVSWDLPNRVANNVNLDVVECKLTQGDFEIKVYKVTGETFPMKKRFTNLEPAVDYTFKIRVQSSTSNIPQSRGNLEITSHWKELPVKTTPAKLSTPMMESKDEKSVTITFQPHTKINKGAVFLYYQLLITKVHDNLEDQKTVTSQSHRTTIHQLKAGQLYEIKVKTVTTLGESPFSEVLSVTTKDLQQTATEKLKESLGIDDLANKIGTKVSTSVYNSTIASLQSSIKCLLGGIDFRPDHIQHSGRCFRLSKFILNHASARSTCQSYGGILWEPRSLSETKTVVDAARKIIGNAYVIGIGIIDASSEGKWKYSSTGTSLTFTNWYGNEPDSGASYDCAYAHIAYSGRWFDDNCSTSLPFVCEF